MVKQHLQFIITALSTGNHSGCPDLITIPADAPRQVSQSLARNRTAIPLKE